MARTKGAKNKDKEEFRDRIKRYCIENNADPFIYLADMLRKPKVPYSVKVVAAKELAQYLQPKLRSIEVTGDPEKPLMVMSPEDRQRRIQELEAKRAKRIVPLTLVDPEVPHDG